MKRRTAGTNAAYDGSLRTSIDAGGNLVDAELTDVVVQMVVGPQLGDAFFQRSAAGKREGSTSRLLTRTGRAEEMRLLVQQGHQGLAVLDQLGLGPWLTSAVIEIPQRLEDAGAVEMQRAVPVRQAENPFAGLDDLAIPGRLVRAADPQRRSRVLLEQTLE